MSKSNDYSDFRDKYGLDYNEKHSKMKSPGAYSRSSGGDGYAADNGAIFTENGVYVGTAKGTKNDDGEMVYDNFGSLRSAAEGIKKDAEGKGFSNFGSLSDVAGAVNWLTKGDDSKAKAKEKAEAYKQSATLSKARAGVKAYNEEILPNFGTYLFGKPGQAQSDYLDAYTFNLRNEVKDKEIVGDLGIDLNAGPEEKQMEEEQAVLGVDEAARFD